MNQFNFTNISLNTNNRCIIILNTHLNKILLEYLCTNSSESQNFIICADGGCNQLYKMNSNIIPDVIIGDFDSIELEAKQHYQNAQVIQLECQDTTDLEKALEFIIKHPPFDFQDIIIYGGFCGRLDHTLANLSTLVAYSDKLENSLKQKLGQIIQFGDFSIVRYLKPGNYIYLLNEQFEQRKGAGLFPGCFSSAKLDTKGFQWNLTSDNPLVFGNFISSSNVIVEQEIEIRNQDGIFFITQLLQKYQSE